MLVLRRRQNESIVIGDGNTVRVIVLEIKNGSVALGFDAPDGVPVVRSELLERTCKGATDEHA